jgi:hypothetical protein
VAEVAQGDDPIEGVRSIAACESPATIRIEGLGTVDMILKLELRSIECSSINTSRAEVGGRVFPVTRFQ